MWHWHKVGKIQKWTKLSQKDTNVDMWLYMIEKTVQISEERLARLNMNKKKNN